MSYLHLESLNDLIKAQLLLSKKDKPDNKSLKPLVTISRGYGTGGAEIGKQLAEQLDIPFFDTDILTAMEKLSDIGREQLEQLDEHVSHFRNNWLSSLIPGSSNDEITYTRDLINIVLGMIPTGGVVVGRGAHLILGAEHAFRVFIVGSTAQCALRIAKKENCTEEQAFEYIEAVNKERALFIEQLFDVKWNVPTQYDLTINTDYLSFESAVELIVHAITCCNHAQRTQRLK